MIPGELVPRIRWLETFGKLIANTDMHFGNLSFLTCGATVVGLAPAYDMFPMGYAPRQGHITRRDFQPPLPEPAHAALWQKASVAAEDFWSRVAANPLVSKHLI